MTYAGQVPVLVLHSRSLWLAPLLGGAGLLLSGCFKATFVSGPSAADPRAKQAPRSESFWQHEYVFGLLGAGSLDLRDVCESDAAQIETGGDLLTTAISVFSVGIYTPRTIFVRCQAPTDASAAAPRGKDAAATTKRDAP